MKMKFSFKISYLRVDLGSLKLKAAFLNLRLIEFALAKQKVFITIL